MIKEILIAFLIVISIAPSGWGGNSPDVASEAAKLFHKRAWVSVELKSGDKVEGELTSISVKWFIVDVNKKKLSFLFDDVVTIKQIRAPQEELSWTLILGALTLIIFAIVYKDYT